MKKPLLALALGLAITPSIAQNINVVVDGDPVTFNGVGPQQVRGRVLVPLRGVLEKMGAYVGWDAASQTVTANRTGVDIELRIGRAFGRVNGREIPLDVPAQVFRGSTLVPLRFVSEALGADVRWEANTQSVLITTGDVGNQNQGFPRPNPNPNPNVNPNTGTVRIESFDIDQPDGYVRAGTTIRFTVRGTPGATASLEIPGVAENVRLNETSPGVYTGTFVVPNTVNVSRASAVARLRLGDTERYIQAGNPLTIDTQAPRLSSPLPEPDTRVSSTRPNISGQFDDAGGSGIDRESVRILLNGRDVTADATITNGFFVLRPDVALQAGRNEVEVRARDQAGNSLERRWTFNVQDAGTVIRSFDFRAAEGFEPGNDITFTLIGQAGGEATFSIGNVVRDRAMREVEPGRYVGTYTIRRGDVLAELPVSARLRTAGGETFSTESTQRLTVETGPLTAPTIAAPPANSALQNPLTIRGTAPAGTRVLVRVGYSRSVLGAFAINGIVSEQTVDVDARGNWQTEAIRIGGLALGDGTTYTITAVTLGAGDRRSEESTLRLRSSS